MANDLMKYRNEKEEKSFTVPQNKVFSYNFSETYVNAKVQIDCWNGELKPTITHDNLFVTITAQEDDQTAVGTSAVISIIELN